jgi:hypothetical protein
MKENSIFISFLVLIHLYISENKSNKVVEVIY